MNRHAILIANWVFTHPNLPQLTSPEKDIDDLAAVLSDPTRGFKVHPPLKNRSSDDIINDLATALTNVDPDDLVVIYYTGHGLLDDKLHLSLAAANTRPKFPRSVVKFSEVMENVETSRLKRVVVLLDCCYAGAASRDLEMRGCDQPSEQVVREIVEERGFKERTKEALENAAALEKLESKGAEAGFYLMTASSASQPAYGQKNGLGLFTEYLVQGFKGKAVTYPDFEKKSNNALGYVTVNGLFRHIHRGIQDAGGVQTPRLFVFKATSDDLTIAEISALAGDHTTADFRPWSEICILENLVPTYLLDEEFRFVHWNAAFQIIVAEPLKLKRGKHVETFLVKLENWETDVKPTSLRDFPPNVPNVQYPRVHTESLKLRTARWGYIDFTKVASHLRDKKANWCVMLNISYAERRKALWQGMRQAMTLDETWSRYAESYDPIIAEFSENKALVDKVVAVVGSAQNCLDIGAGTGSATLKLLDGNPTRTVHAIDVNYYMLKRLYDKLEKNADFKRRTHISHCDCITALSEVKNSTYDACIMMNVLFALSKPIDCLKEIYRVLKPGAVLSLCTSNETTNIEALFAQIASELSANPAWSEEVQTLHNEALQRNRELLPLIRQYSEADAVGFLREAGFSPVSVIKRGEYVGCVFIAKAIKTATPPPTPMPSGKN